MKQHEIWLIKAKNDIKSSKKLLEGEDPILDTAVYHTQQCAEKALKAYLAYKNNKIEKTHDVGYLVSLCRAFDLDFSQLMDDADILNPFNSFFRYPDVVLEPDIEDVKDAIKRALYILEFVEKKISS